MRVRIGGIGLIILGVVSGLALLVAVTPMGRYLARGVYEEGRILWRRRAIASIISDSGTPAAVRAKLALVLDARRFAVDSLGLPAKGAFTKFTQLDHDTLVLVLSAAYRDRLEPVTWWFPVVGRVPYKGFFGFDDARRAEQALLDAGFDSYLRPSPAFSTLGFFNDPLLSTTLHEDSLEIVNTVIHELTHNRYYASGRAVFNESFASFVGARGAERFFLARGDTARARRVSDRWQDDLLLGAVWERAFRSLDSAFRAHPDAATLRQSAPPSPVAAGDTARAARLTARDTVYARTRRLLTDSIAPHLRTIDPGFATRVRLDNAALLARRIYSTGLDGFEAVWEREGHDVRRALEAIITANRNAP